MRVSELVDDLRRIIGDRDATWIVEDVVGCGAGGLVGVASDDLTARQVAHADALAGRRRDGEPIQYVLGHWPFRSLDLLVDRRVLIPRPETEVLVDVALGELARRFGALNRGSPEIRVVDLGTGSGAIALSLAREVPTAQVHAVDRSADALAVARANLAGVGRAATRVRLHHGSWFGALPADLAGAVDLVVSNPPYVSPAAVLEASVIRWEPAEALFGSGDGLGDVAAVLDSAARWLAPGGAVVCEIDADRSGECLAIAERAGYAWTALRRDLAGRDRFVVARVSAG